jgi:glycine/D-amino acid oxidase-like deaminating enzyme
MTCPPQVSLGTVVVAGASPAGIATAVGLAKRGARVIVVDPRQGPAVNESFPLIVNSRGKTSIMHALGMLLQSPSLYLWLVLHISFFPAHVAADNTQLLILIDLV